MFQRKPSTRQTKNLEGDEDIDPLPRKDCHLEHLFLILFESNICLGPLRTMTLLRKIPTDKKILHRISEANIDWLPLIFGCQLRSRACGLCLLC